MTVIKTRRMLYALLVSLIFIEALCAHPKIEFWDQQRKGANCFNVEPREQWFAAAHDLGLDWVRLTYSKWKGQQRDFLMGNADQFTGIVRQDLAKLVQVLDWAHKHDIKVVLAPLGLPGNRWRQNNGTRPDLRLWQDKSYWQQAAQFWGELAASLKDHPAIVAYNIINEPIPEKGTGLAEDGPAERYLSWYIYTGPFIPIAKTSGTAWTMKWAPAAWAQSIGRPRRPVLIRSCRVTTISYLM
jgi:hypothetical protein